MIITGATQCDASYSGYELESIVLRTQCTRERLYPDGSSFKIAQSALPVPHNVMPHIESTNHNPSSFAHSTYVTESTDMVVFWMVQSTSPVAHNVMPHIESTNHNPSSFAHSTYVKESNLCPERWNAELSAFRRSGVPTFHFLKFNTPPKIGP